MGSWNNCTKNIVPFAAMAALECTIVSVQTLYKAAHSKGLNYYVFIAYTHTLASLILLPLVFIFSRRGLPTFKLSVLNRIILLAVIGFLSKMCGFKGIEYSSPALSSSISTLLPAFTFILAVLSRMEILDLRSSSTQAKIIGTIVSISGALVAVLYQGPTILPSQSAKVSSSHSLKTSQMNWAIGGLFFVTDQLLNSISFILMSQVLKIYPSELAPSELLLHYSFRSALDRFCILENHSEYQQVFIPRAKNKSLFFCFLNNTYKEVGRPLGMFLQDSRLSVWGC